MSVLVLLVTCRQTPVPQGFFNNQINEPEPQKVTQVIPKVKAEPVAKVETKAVEAPASEPTPVAVERPVEYHSDDFYMEYIFQHESSGNSHAENSLGCLGLGQACPGTKLTSICPNLGDVACQVQFFTNYAVTRYGSWANAYSFWVNNHWW